MTDTPNAGYEGGPYLLAAHLSCDARVHHLPADGRRPKQANTLADRVKTVCGKFGRWNGWPPRGGRGAVCRACQRAESASPITRTVEP